jgi:sec-independent protein translocase protein TatB
MFDVGFSELLVIAVVALLVLGPERLPKAARFAGLWVRRARAQWNSVKAEFERDLADEDLKRSLRETQEALRDAQASLRDAGSGFQRELQDARQSLMQGTGLAAGTTAPDALVDDRSAEAKAYEERDYMDERLHDPSEELTDDDVEPSVDDDAHAAPPTIHDDEVRKR